MPTMIRVTIIAVALSCISVARAAEPSREQIITETMKPYAGTSEHGVNTTTLTGKVMCGYQGWFAADGDALGRGFYHWSMNPHDFRPGNCKIDLWPDVSELDAD